MESKLRAYPFQIIETDDKIILKRGVSTLAIPDKTALIVVQVVQKALMQGDKTLDELASLFAGNVRELVKSFIMHLVNRNYISAVENFGKHNLNEESYQDIFYWHFNAHQEQIAQILNEKIWAFIGINELNKKLIRSLLAEGKDNFIVVDDPALRNIKFFNDHHEITDEFWQDYRIQIVTDEAFLDNHRDAGFIIASSEFGSFYLLESWNEFAVHNRIPFYPVLLQDMVGYLGPFVLADEGACLQCVKLRQNSARSEFEDKRLSEKYAFEGQKVVGYHRSMLNILAEAASFELIKFKTNIQWDLNSLCEIDLLNSTMNKRKIVKAPRCPVCSALNQYPLENLNKRLTSEESWKEIEQTVGYDETYNNSNS